MLLVSCQGANMMPLAAQHDTSDLTVESTDDKLLSFNVVAGARSVNYN